MSRTLKLLAVTHAWNERERRLCTAVNRVVHRPWLRGYFIAVSRLGDGVLWYALMMMLPLALGRQAWGVTAQLFITAIVGLGVYKAVKHFTQRPRPCAADRCITAAGRMLDEYSFPSGHTLHATSLTTVACAQYPHLGWVLVPFAASVAASRVILGLHYPTDVAAGALIGAALAATVMRVFVV